MLIHYLKITFRGLLKDKAFSFINIIGLTIAIACCFLFIFWVNNEQSYEKCFSNSDRIYKLIEKQELKDGIYHNAYLDDMTSQLKRAFPQIEAATYLYNEMAPLAKDTEEDGVMMIISSTNEDFLRMFDFDYVEGSPQNIVRDKSVIITQEAAYKYWKNESALGKRLMQYGNTYTIGAVIKMPKKTQLRFDILQINNPYDKNGKHFFMLKDKTTMSSTFKQQLSQFLVTTKDTESALIVQPLKDVHLHSPKDITLKEQGGVSEFYGNYAQVLFFWVAVLLILFMAIINYVNTSIARAMSRMKEVGVRKVTGANQRQLIERFLFESFIITAIAVIISMGITKFVFPDFSEIMGNQISLDFNTQTILIAIVVCIIISVLSGGYAAFYLSSIKPALILKGGTKTGTKDGLRKGLLFIQFFLSIAILISTTFVYKQINAIFNEETGMSRKNIVILDTGLWYQAEDFINIIKRENPNIINASMSNSPPYNAPWAYSSVTWEGKDTYSDEINFTQIFCDHNFANTFGLELVKGEFIPPGLSWWQGIEEESFNIVINESFAKQMRMENPIGVSVTYNMGTGKIIGVVKDFNFKPLKEKTAPLFLSFNPEAASKMYVKTSGKDTQSTLEYLLVKYKEMKPDWAKRPVIYHTVEDEYNEIYADELRTAKILSVFSVISFFLSLMGVFSMISFMIEKRTKEIAIRKINGANVLDIIRLFCTDIMRIGFAATIMAIPLCYIILQKWLEGYIYRTSLSWWIFLLIPLILIFTICFIISIQIWFSVRKKAVESLRSE